MPEEVSFHLHSKTSEESADMWYREELTINFAHNSHIN